MRTRNIQTSDFLRDGFAKRAIQGCERDDSKRRIKFVSNLIEELHKDAVAKSVSFNSHLIDCRF